MGEMVDWERQLSEIIDKSHQDLSHVYGEALGPTPSHSRPVFCHSTAHQRSQRSDGLENAAPCGPHQTAAARAFHAARRGARPPPREGAAADARRVEARAQRSVERRVDDQLTGSARAIDGLRDQLAALADEVRQLRRSAAAQERRADGLVRDAAGRRDVVDGLEARALDEGRWRQSVGADIGRLKQAWAQQQGDIAARATVVEMKAGFESSRHSSAASIDAAASPLHAAMRKEVRTLMEEVTAVSRRCEQHRKHVSDDTQAFQRNLVKTMQRAVKEEASLAEQRCIGAAEKKLDKLQRRNDKEVVRLITQIVTAAATQIEASLKRDALAKLEKGVLAKLKGQRQQDAKLVKEGVGAELAAVKELLQQTAAKQAQCISKKNAMVLVGACRSQCAEHLAQSEERLTAAISRSEKDRALEAMAISLSSHGVLLQSLQKEQDKVSDALEKFATKEDAAAAAQALVTDADRRSGDRLASQISECRAQWRETAIQLRNFVTREDAGTIAETRCHEECERCIKLMQDMTQSRVRECEAQLRTDLSAQLRNLATKEDVSVIAVEECKRQCERRTKDKEQVAGARASNIDELTTQLIGKSFVTEEDVDARLRTHVREWKSQLVSASSSEPQNFATKEDVHAIADIKSQEQLDRTKTQFSECRAEFLRASEQLKHFVTKEDVAIAERKNNEQFERCMRMVANNQHTSQAEATLRKDECENIAVTLQNYITKKEVLETPVSKGNEQFGKCVKLMETTNSHLRDFVTKSEASDIAQSKCREQVEWCVDIIDDKVKSHMTSNQAALCESIATRTEARVNEVESDLGNKMTQMLDVVESFEERVQAVENSHADLGTQLASRLDDEAGIERRIHAVDERLESKIASLAEVIGDVPERLRAMSDVVCSVEQIKESAHKRRLEDSVYEDDGRLGCSISNLRSTLQAAFCGGTATSTVSSMHRDMQVPTRLSSANPPVQSPDDKEPPVSDVVFPKTPRPPEQVGVSSPPSIVHLLGLSPDGASRSPESPRDLIREQHRLLMDVTRTPSDVSKKRDGSSLHTLAAEMCSGLLLTSLNDQRSQSTVQSIVQSIDINGSTTESQSTSINTADAMSLCGVHLDESHLYLSKPDSPASAVDRDGGSKIQSDSELHPNKPESPSSTFKNIVSADAILPGRTAADQPPQSPSLDETSSSSSQATESLAGQEGEADDNPSDKDPPSDVSSSSLQALELLVKQISGVEGGGEIDNPLNKTPPSDEISSSSSQALESLVEIETDDRHRSWASSSPQSVESDPTFLSQELESDSGNTPIRPDRSGDNISSPVQADVSVPGSMTSCDTVTTVCRPMMQHIKDEREPTVQYNPTRVLNPEPYQGWDSLLTELQASGLLLRDNKSTSNTNTDSDSNEGVSSYGSSSFCSQSSG